MNDDELREVLQVLEQPVEVDADFADRVLRTMQHELDLESGTVATPKAEPTAPAVELELRERSLRRRPAIGLAAAAVIAILAASLVLVTRSAPSALAALQEARARFGSLPPYHARAAVSANDRSDNPDFETRWETEDWYRDRDTWRTAILESNSASAGQPGDFQVLAGGLYGQYRAEADVFTVTPVAERDGHPDSPAFFFDPRLQWWGTGVPGEPGKPSDRFFEEDCSATDGTYIGREVTKLHCPAERSDIDLWLDKETGMLLRISVFDVRREITSIEFDPEFAAGIFEVQAPEGARKRWGGTGTPPPEYRVPLGSEVAARYEVAGPNDGMLIASIGQSAIWIVVIRCGEQRCDHQLRGVDPRTGKSITTFDPPDLAYINDVKEVDGEIWVSMSERRRTPDGDGGEVPATTFVQRFDPATGGLVGPRIVTGQEWGSLVAVGRELWSTGGEVREETVGPALPRYHTVARVDTATGQVTQVRLDGGAIGRPVLGDGLVWVATEKVNSRDPYRDDYAVVAIDPETNAVVHSVSAPGYPNLVTFDAGRLYAVFNLVERGAERSLIGSAGKGVTTFATQQIASSGAQVGGGGALTAGTIWLASFGQDAVLKIDANSLQVTGTVATGRGPGGIAAGLGSIW